MWTTSSLLAQAAVFATDATRLGETPIPRLTRWAPFFSLTDGRLLGAECIVERSASVGGSDPTGSESCGRRALDAAMNLADDLLRVGCPLLLTVALRGGELDDPEVTGRLEEWSLDHGGAHGLLGVEIDVGAWDRRSRMNSRRIAALGYEVTLGGATTIDPTVSRYGARRFAISPSLVRLSDIDVDLAEHVRDLAAEARSYELEPLFKGMIDPTRAACLQGLRGEGAWQPDATAVSFDADCLHALALDLADRRDLPPTPVLGRPRDLARVDLTWVTVE